MPFASYAWLFATGLFAGIFGSMVGLGGGFMVVPVLRLGFGLSPAAAAGDSLVMIVANTIGSTGSYLLQRRVDVRLGILAAIGGLPGNIAGAYAVKYTSAQVFDFLFAGMLLVAGADVAFRQSKRRRSKEESNEKRLSWHQLLFFGFLVGVISSLFGVGGGLVLVPSLFYFTDLGAHVVSGTSHFTILLTSPVGVAAHVLQHDVSWGYSLPLAAGALFGGPIGARLSRHVSPQALPRLVGVALALAAIAMVARHLT